MVHLLPRTGSASTVVGCSIHLVKAMADILIDHRQVEFQIGTRLTRLESTEGSNPHGHTRSYRSTYLPSHTQTNRALWAFIRSRLLPLI